jgi:hypothetical protein
MKNLIYYGVLALSLIPISLIAYWKSPISDIVCGDWGNAFLWLSNTAIVSIIGAVLVSGKLK